MLRLLFLLLTICVSTCTINADLSVAPIFGNDMIVQCDKPIHIWGSDKSGVRITVRFSGQSIAAKTDENGNWAVTMQPLTANSKPQKMIVEGSNKIVFNNILVGEVWICSGQSNMELKVSSCLNEYSNILKQADIPMLRHIDVERQIGLLPMDSFKGKWQICNSKNVLKLSAVGFFFGRYLVEKLKAPVGLVNISWGGSPIESWTPSFGYKNYPKLQDEYEEAVLRDASSDEHKRVLKRKVRSYQKWCQAALAGVAKEQPVTSPPVLPKELYSPNSHKTITSLYNGMVHPLIQFAVRGVIWYQGEANIYDGAVYADKMKALVASWRKAWKDPDMPFYFVQLAPFEYLHVNPNWLPLIWEAQQRAADETSNCDMVVINDVGNIDDIHPRKKRPVGKRLAMMALSKTYGFNNKEGIQCLYPKFKSMSISGNTVTIELDNADGLKSRDGQPLNSFGLCDEAGNLTKADVKIIGKKLELAAKGIEKPCGVLFAWNQVSQPNLVNGNGLPMGAFRAGKVPGDLFSSVDGTVLQNGSFEEGEEKPYKWKQWHGRPSDFEWTDKESKVGNKSVAILATKDKTGCSWIYESFIPIEPLEEYVLRGWIKTHNVAGDCYIAIVWYTKTKRWIRTTRSDFINRTHDWRELVIKAKAPKNAKYAKVFVGKKFSGGGVCYFDDLVFTKFNK